MGLVVLRVLHEGDTSARKRYAINYITGVCMCSEEREIILLVSQGVPETGTSENKFLLLSSLNKEDPEIWKL